MTSQDMRLDSVVADPGRALVYNSRVVGWPQMQPMDAQATDSFRSIVLVSTCSDSGKDFLAKGIALRTLRFLTSLTVQSSSDHSLNSCQDIGVHFSRQSPLRAIAEFGIGYIVDSVCSDIYTFPLGIVGRHSGQEFGLMTW